MTDVRLAALLALDVAAAWLLTAACRRYALARDVLDHPNERSSHAVATPRGGGIAIVLVTLVSLVLLSALGMADRRALLGLVGGGAFVAWIGFADDHGHVAARVRLLTHFVAAVWLLVWIGGLAPVAVLGWTVSFGPLGYALAALYVVWMLNLTNFMDGIDGIAASEAVSVSLGSVLCGVVAHAPIRATAGAAVLAASTLGFLLWNWPPARIFMGDVGSGFLGFTLAALSLIAAAANPALLWCWLILSGVFVVDATVTLARRVMRRQRFYQAHRTHAYQWSARRCGAHRPVTIAVVLVNVGWLLPLALLTARGVLPGIAALAIAYVPLVVAAVKLKAGVAEAMPAGAP